MMSENPVPRPPIRQLSPDVVNRIAAGEVIQRPQNAVKELIENSLDAGAKHIQVTVKFQGSDVKMLQVKDDGCGIPRDDLRLACERFCTSKLQSFDDLNRMETFGFRGEALASISQIAHVDIISRTSSHPIGFQMKYETGKPVGDLTPVAANVGTIVTVRDLFYNYGQRKLQSAHQEYSLILDVVSLYALNNLQVCFTLQKVGAEADLKANPVLSLIQRIKLVIGQKVASNLTEIQSADSQLKYEATGVAGDLKSSLKTYRFVFFINKRLVECPPLKKSLETLYRNVLPKGNCAFVLISLLIDPEHIDVNVHPTKKEVRFLHEEEIVGQITEKVQQVLSESSQSNNVIAGSKNSQSTSIQTVKTTAPVSSPAQKTGSTTPYQRQDSVIRADHTMQRIDDSFRRQTAQKSIAKPEYRRSFKLESLVQLKAAVIHSCDAKLKKIFAESSLVGRLTGTSDVTALIQYRTYLLQVNLSAVTEELFYWLILGNFGNFPEMNIQTSVSLAQMLELDIKRREGNDSVSLQTISQSVAKIVRKRDMLYDYFSMKIDTEGKIRSLPVLITGYVPDWKKLPALVHDMAFNVDWKKEKECFDSFGKALAKFNAITIDSVDRPMISSLIYPEVKARFRPSSKMQDFMSNLTSVPTLYRVFERC